MSALPANWETSLISQVFCTIKEKGKESSVPYLEIGDVDIDNKTYKLTQKPSVKGCLLARKGDVLISRVRPTRGAIVQIKEDTLNVSSAFTILRNEDTELNHYLWLFLAWNTEYLNYLGDNCTGTMYPTVAPQIVTKYKIPIAPKKDRLKITAGANALLRQTSETRCHLERINGLINCFRKSILSAALSGRLTTDWRKRFPEQAKSPGINPLINSAFPNIPLTWTETRLGEVISELRYGTSKKCSYNKSGLPVLRIPNIAKGVISHAAIKYAEFNSEEVNKLALLPGDILLIRSNGSVSLVGKTAIVTEAEKGYLFAGYLIRIRVNRQIIDPRFLQYMFSSTELRTQIEVPARSTSGVNNINSDEVKQLRIALPPLKEQIEIVKQIERMFILADTIENKHNAAQTATNKLPHSILAKAFRGELG